MILPLPLLVGLLLALGVRDLTANDPLTRQGAWERLPSLCWGLGVWCVVVLVIGVALGLWASPRKSAARVNLLTRWWARIAEWSAVAVFGCGLYLGRWADVAERLLPIENAVLIDELAILAPFLVMQVVAWLASYPVERAIGCGVRSATLRDHLGLRVRQCLGMLLPMLVMYALGHDLIERWFPATNDQPAAQLALLTVLSSVMLLLSPLFLRISWRTRRLESGPLRRRLERVSQRFGFRCSDILVWETGGTIVNAGVTGALPWFRYVILTDALIDRLGAREVEAVFGHELGHIKHRHLAYFGFFFIGSVAAFSVLESWLHTGLESRFFTNLFGEASMAATAVEWVILAALLITYVLFVFGFLSRRFERQADLFGCQVVSCDRVECPPHADIDGGEQEPTAVPASICPVGIEIFSKALREVAFSNGLPVRAPSWRHGSIAQRLGFLERVSTRREDSSAFQRSVWRLRWALGIVLAAMLVASLWIGPPAQ